MCENHGIDLAYASTNHHQSNGLAERFFRTFVDSLSAAVDQERDRWDLEIHRVCLGYRIVPQSSTEETPAFMNYGRDILTPGEVMFNLQYEGSTPGDHKRSIMRVLSDVHKNAAENIKKAQRVYKTQHDKHVTKTQQRLEPGQLVWLQTREAQSYRGFRPKLSPRFDKLMRVVKRDGDHLTLATPGKPSTYVKLANAEQVKEFAGTEQQWELYLQGGVGWRDEEELCRVCGQLDALSGRGTGIQKWVQCSSPHARDNWFHLECLGLSEFPKKKRWFCPTCAAKRNGRRMNAEIVSDSDEEQ
jgi:hypothetical protein